MKFGACVDWRSREKLTAAKEAGADFVELNLSKLAVADDEEIASLAEFLKENNIPCLSYTGMLPATHRVTGKDKDHAKAAAFVDMALSKVAILGAKNIVFGSGGARDLREGDDRAAAEKELDAFVRDYLAPVFEKHGCICAIESLSEGNIVQTMEESYRLCRAADHPNIKLLCDFYHVWKNDEPMTEYRVYGPLINHVHVASISLCRKMPREGDGDEEKYLEMFRLLSREGYDGAVSLEGHFDGDFGGEIKAGLMRLRECYAKA